jgi:hypothetical protein
MSPIDGHKPQDDPQDFIDPKGYWADPERNIRRTSGEQHVVLTATDECTKGEWLFVLDGLGIRGTD